MVDGADVAFRLGRLSGSSFGARKLPSLDRVIVATPANLALRGTPRSPTDLENALSGILRSEAAVNTSWASQVRYEMPLNPSSMLSKLLYAPVRPGAVIWLGVRPQRRATMHALQTICLNADHGLNGDRYSKAGGARQVTLIEAEHLASIASHLGVSEIRPQDVRRNIVTRGINLLGLKERKFKIGSVVLETTGECHPCSRMEENLGIGGYNAVRGLGGITARIISGGSISVGDAIEPLPLALGGT